MNVVVVCGVTMGVILVTVGVEDGAVDGWSEVSPIN